MSKPTPSSVASRHLLPQGEKEEKREKNFPSPLAGEGARRAGEGFENKKLNLAKSMRKNPTEMEAKLWFLLRDRRFVEYKFRRQVPMGRYIVDFICYNKKLIVELDGSQHADNKKDVARDKWLNAQGFQVLRIWNNELNNEKNLVLDSIWNALQSGD